MNNNARMPKERVRDFSWYEACYAARFECLVGMAGLGAPEWDAADHCPCPAFEKLCTGVMAGCDDKLKGNWGEELEKLEGRAHALHAHSEFGVGVEPDEFLDDWFVKTHQSTVDDQVAYWGRWPYAMASSKYQTCCIQHLPCCTAPGSAYPLPGFHGQKEEGWKYGLGSAHAKECLDDYKDDLVSLVGNGQEVPWAKFPGERLSAGNYWMLYHDTSTGYALSLLDELFGGGG